MKNINANSEAVSFQSCREIAAAIMLVTAFMHNCWLIAASKLCPSKKSVFENILSRLRVQLVASFDTDSYQVRGRWGIAMLHVGHGWK